jgi:hypothetical protein
MSRASHPTRIVLVAALTASLAGWGSCPSLATTLCAPPSETSPSGSDCCCDQHCDCGPGCDREGTPSKSNERPTLPVRDSKELSQLSATAAHITLVTLVDAAQYRLQVLASRFCADSVWPHTLIAKHTCLRV